MQAVFEQGMTLKQIEDSLRRNNVNAERVHASASTVEAFRKILKDDFISTESYIIVNFARKGVGQKGGGHFSPIAAYHEKTDRVLILDVARYKYAPAWVRLDSLFNAMNTVDDASKKGRGWVRISRIEK